MAGLIAEAAQLDESRPLSVCECSMSRFVRSLCCTAGKSKQDLTRRTSSGNWIDDRVS